MLELGGKARGGRGRRRRRARARHRGRRRRRRPALGLAAGRALLAPVAALLHRGARGARGLESRHLEVLLDGDLVPQALHELLLRELLDLAAARGPRDEVDVHRLEHLAEDQLARAVAVGEDGDGLPAGEVLHGLRDARPLDGDAVLDPAPQEVQHVRAALDDDQRVGLVDVGAGGEVLGAVARDLLDLDGLADRLGEVEPHALRLLLEPGEDLLGALDDLLALRDADILDRDDLDLGAAGADPVDGLEAGGQDGGLDLVERGGDEDLALALALAGVDVHFDAADPSGLLEVAEVELVTEEPLGLAEDGADDVGLVDDALGGDAGLDLVLGGVRVVAHGGGFSVESQRHSAAGRGDDLPGASAVVRSDTTSQGGDAHDRESVRGRGGGVLRSSSRSFHSNGAGQGI